ncbi:MAG: VWA domain-containing protein, partial [Pseudomonadota bacterium]
MSKSDKTIPTNRAGDVGQANSDAAPAQRSAAGDVSQFLKQVKSLSPTAPTAGQRGRLLFGMDATMSRQPTWDLALGLQADMFKEVARIGGLDVQLIFFRGAGECKTSKWVSNPTEVARLMSTVSCRGGRTQIARVLSHARDETKRQRIGALVYVGDAMEENIDLLADTAGELGLLGLK